MNYGDPPIDLGQFDLDWTEFMHYLYLPVSIAGVWAVPDRLAFVMPLVQAICDDVIEGDFVYVTARRGFATPDNPLNRPGWHCDGFGTDDLNYVWWDRWGTRFAEQEFTDISSDHGRSMDQFGEQVLSWCGYPDRHLYRLSPFVVHSTPLLTESGVRSFIKISVSRHRYNLEGNSHNYLLNYDWKMYPRDVARNDPTYAQADFYDAP